MIAARRAVLDAGAWRRARRSGSIASSMPLGFELTGIDLGGADLSADKARGRSPHRAATRIRASDGTALREPSRAARQKNEVHRMRRRAPVVFRSAVLRCLEPLDLIAIDAARHLARQGEPVV